MIIDYASRPPVPEFGPKGAGHLARYREVYSKSEEAAEKLQGDLAAWFGSVPYVPAACKGNKLLGDDGCARQGYNSFERISFWKTPTTRCASQNNACVPYHKWVSDYIAVLGGR